MKTQNVVMLITGSRTLTDAAEIYNLLDQHYDLLTFNKQEIKYLIEGEADGVDKICKTWAEQKGIKVVPYEVKRIDWLEHGTMAGMLRNKQMLDKALELRDTEGLDIYPVAFWDGSSKGTENMINMVRKAGYFVNTHLLGKSKSKRLIFRSGI